jgi:hypothetical protein
VHQLRDSLMARARPLIELGEAIGTAFQIVDAELPLLISATSAPVSETRRMDRLNLRQVAFGRVLAELIENEYE